MAPILPLLARQTIVTAAPTDGTCDNLSGGEIAGIVLGTIAGTLLILWLIITVRNQSYTPRPEPAATRRRRRRRSRASSNLETRAYVADDGRSYRVSSVREPSRVVYAKSERL